MYIDKKFGDVVEVIRSTSGSVEFKYPEHDWTLFMARAAFLQLYKPVKK